MTHTNAVCKCWNDAHWPFMQATHKFNIIEIAPETLFPMLKKQPAPLLRNEGSSENGMPFKFERKGRKRRTNRAYKKKIDITNATFRIQCRWKVNRSIHSLKMQFPIFLYTPFCFNLPVLIVLPFFDLFQKECLFSNLTTFLIWAFH